MAVNYLCDLLKSYPFSNSNILIFDENVLSFWKILSLFVKIFCTFMHLTTLFLQIFNIFKGYMAFEEFANLTSVFVFCIQIFFWMFFIASWTYLLVPIIEILLRKFVIQQDYDLFLPFDCFYPFEPTKDWFTYLAVYIFQMFSMLHIVYCFVEIEIILMALSSYLSTGFILLQNDLMNLIPETNRNNCDSNKEKSMRNLIRRHQKLIRLTQDLDNIFNGIIFMNLSCATIILCLFLVSIIVAKGAFVILKHIALLLSGSFTIYSVCCHAQTLQDASLSIADSAYQSLWYTGNKKHRWAIWFFIIRCEKPCCLTALKYKKIGLNTFLTVMSTTWSYFSVASSVYEDK